MKMNAPLRCTLPRLRWGNISVPGPTLALAGGKDKRDASISTSLSLVEGHVGLELSPAHPVGLAALALDGNGQE